MYIIVYTPPILLRAILPKQSNRDPGPALPTEAVLVLVL